MNNDERNASRDQKEPTITLLLSHLQEMRQAVPVNYQLKAALREKLQEQMRKMDASAFEAVQPRQMTHRRRWWTVGILAAAAAVALLIGPSDSLRLGAPQTLPLPLQLDPEQAAIASHAEQVAYLTNEQKLYTYPFAEEASSAYALQLPQTNGRYTGLAWANRSAQLAVTESGGDRARLWIMHAAEGGARARSQLLWEATDSDVSAPDWSPDDRWIAFTRTRGDRSEIWLVDILTLQAKRLTDGHHPVWSPDGTMLAFVNEKSVWLLNLADNSTVRVDEGDYPSWAEENVLTYTTPSGQLVAVQTAEQPFHAETVPFSPAKEGELKRVSWTEDGKRLLSAVETKEGMIFFVAKRDR